MPPLIFSIRILIYWLSTGAGISGIAYTLIITSTYVRIELTIGRASTQENKHYFNLFLKRKETIESIYGGQLSWEELPNNKMSRVKAQVDNVNLFEDEDWSKMNEFIVDKLPKFKAAFQPVIDKIRNN